MGVYLGIALLLRLVVRNYNLVNLLKIDSHRTCEVLQMRKKKTKSPLLLRVRGNNQTVVTYMCDL